MEEALLTIPKTPEYADCGEHGILVTAVIQSKKQVTSCHQSGYLSLPLLKKIMNHNVSICDCITDVIRIYLTKDSATTPKRKFSKIGNLFLLYLRLLIVLYVTYSLSYQQLLRAIIYSITNLFEIN